ncbi:MAG: zf-HC2 domain-containing protein [Proteobacteria bacterium]|nr:zf-HC2 domain-containing protein [Pseudomonadota bacterium]
MMKCREATQKMSEELERPLTPGEQVSLMVHTAMCRPCRNFRRQAAFLAISARRAKPEPGSTEYFPGAPDVHTPGGGRYTTEEPTMPRARAREDAPRWLP